VTNQSKEDYNALYLENVNLKTRLLDSRKEVLSIGKQYKNMLSENMDLKEQIHKEVTENKFSQMQDKETTQESIESIDQLRTK